MKENLAVLSKVEKPGRYTGGELNLIIKDAARVKVTFALAFPDIYEVGMSYLGYKILYHILNKEDFIAAERVYAPWVDMEKYMRESNTVLKTLESDRPLNEFDLVGFTLQYELSYTNILNMLDLGKIPLFSKDRTLEHPFVVGGGPCVYNPEPLADFFDFFIIGEGEEIIVEVSNLMNQWKNEGKKDGREGFLRLVSKIQGIYVPSFYKVEYSKDGAFENLVQLEEIAPAYINKRIVQDMDSIDYPTSPIVPFTEIVHDRIMLEVFRGCTRGCRFCHAGIVYRPVRERKMSTLQKLARQLVDNTGYGEMSLVSLSTADYSCLSPLLKNLMDEMKKERVSVSLPSLRIDSFSVDLAKQVQEVRKSGLTFAPEAGTQRMRDVINKGVQEEDLLAAVSAAFKAGWTSVKLYFMIGLPTETQEDIAGIADLAYKVLDCYKEITGKRNCKITVSVSSFVPKPWTPFQWSKQDNLEEIKEKQLFLKSLFKNKAISYQYHDAKTSVLEGIFARGDRRLGAVLYSAWQQGAKFDGWSEHFKYDLWLEVLEQAGLVKDSYVGEHQEQEGFAWEHIRPGVTREFLWREYQKALQECLTEDCRHGKCSNCGVCPELSTHIVDYTSEVKSS